MKERKGCVGLRRVEGCRQNTLTCDRAALRIDALGLWQHSRFSCVLSSLSSSWFFSNIYVMYIFVAISLAPGPTVLIFVNLLICPSSTFFFIKKIYITRINSLSRSLRPFYLRHSYNTYVCNLAQFLYAYQYGLFAISVFATT